MKRFLLFFAAAQILFLCGCHKTAPADATATDSAAAGSLFDSIDDSSYGVATKSSSELEAEKAYDQIVNPAVKIDDGRLLIGSTYKNVQLSDNTLLFYDCESTNGSVYLTAVSLPDYKFVNGKRVAIRVSSSDTVQVEADQGRILVFDSQQAIALDSGMNTIGTVDFPNNENSGNIVSVNSNLSRILYYDSEGLKAADADFQDPSLLFSHPQYDPVAGCGTEYESGSFVDGDNKVFTTITGRDNEGDLATLGLGVFDLNSGKTYTKSCLLEWHGSNATDIEDKHQDVVNLTKGDKNSEYDLISFDDQSCAFTEKIIASVPNGELIGTSTLSNTYVGVNSRYIVYTGFDDQHHPMLCRYDRGTGKTARKVFPSDACDTIAYSDDEQNGSCAVLKFQPYLILPDGRAAIQFTNSSAAYLVDFQ